MTMVTPQLFPVDSDGTYLVRLGHMVQQAIDFLDTKETITIGPLEARCEPVGNHVCVDFFDTREGLVIETRTYMK